MADLVTVAAYTDVLMAHVARSALESEGIRCFLQNEHTVGVHWLYSNAVGGVQVQVLAADAETASKILAGETPAAEAAWNSEGTGAEDEPEPEGGCPYCGGNEIIYNNTTRIFAALSLLISFPLPFFRKRRTCKTCGKKWK